MKVGEETVIIVVKETEAITTLLLLIPVLRPLVQAVIVIFVKIALLIKTEFMFNVKHGTVVLEKLV